MLGGLQFLNRATGQPLSRPAEQPNERPPGGAPYLARNADAHVLLPPSSLSLAPTC